MVSLSSLKPAVVFLSTEAIFNGIRDPSVLGEAICKGVFYSWIGKPVIHSKPCCSESVSLRDLDFSVLTQR